MLERTFIQKIIEAIDTKYLSALCNYINWKIAPPIPTILEFLHNNYECITPQQLDEKTTTVKWMIYDLSQPIDIIFNNIKDLVEYTRAAEAELTQSQTINLALVILNRQWIFKDDIRAWKRTNQAYKTWENFKDDFREAHLEFRETGGTIDELGFHNANAIIGQMMARLQINEEKCTSTATEHTTELTSANQANSTMESQMQTLLNQFQAFQRTNIPNHGKNYVRRRGCGRRCGAVRDLGCVWPLDTPTPKYCWIHQTSYMAAKNAYTLPIDTRRMRPSRTWWAASTTGATTLPNERQVQ